jgi:neutral amino acid transport system permease protein
VSPGRTVLDLGRPWRRRRRSQRPASSITTRLALLLGLLLAPLVLVASASPASAATCFAGTAEAGCISGTIRTEVDVVPDVDVTITGPGGFEEIATSDERGKWSVTVTELGEYTATVDEETLPEGIGVTGDQGSVTVNITNLAQGKAVTFGVRTGEYSATVSTADRIIRSTFSGLRLGLLLALASIGLSLIYGTTGLSNFAHAEQVTMGGMVGYLVVNQWGVNPWLGCVLVVIFCGFTGYLQDRGIWQPLRRRGLGLAQMMIVTIGLALALQYTYQFFIASDTVKIVLNEPAPRGLGPINYNTFDVMAMVISIAVIAAVGYALLRTRIGRATRAVSDNPALASASGIDVDKVIRLVWTVAAALAGLSGILYSLVIQHGMRWDSGLQILLLLFAAVTLGGLGTAFGALVGSLIIGLVVELAPVFGAPGDLKYASALLILILLLMVRPQGILGRAERVG